MYAEQRQRKILDILEDTGRVSVSDLTEEFDVASETIRRDLDHLAELSLLLRVHGGAIAQRTGVVEPDLPTKLHTNVPAKRGIAQAVASVLTRNPRASLLLDAGSTTGELIPLLHESEAPIITNGLDVAQSAVERGLTVQFLPGRVRGTTRAAVGASTVATLASLHPDIAVLGCNGMSEAGFTTPDPEEAAVKRAMVQAASYRIVVADSSKAGVTTLVAFAGLEDIDLLVTDSGLSDTWAKSFESNGIEVVRA